MTSQPPSEINYDLTSFLGESRIQGHDPFRDPIQMFFQKPRDMTHIRLGRDSMGQITIQKTIPPYKVVILSYYGLIDKENGIVEVHASYDRADLRKIMEGIGYKQGFGTAKNLNIMAAELFYRYTIKNLEKSELADILH